EHMGVVVEIQQLDHSDTGGDGWSMKIGDAKLVLVDCRLGDSISVNGTSSFHQYDQEKKKILWIFI
ncbi:2972_t:CDS:1, partial [Racocetra fulgida]